jgi:hypothetical protein
MATSDNSLISFKAIASFTTELGELFSKRQRSLKLYCRLINKTTVAHDKPIQKHISAFRKFCMANRTAITQKDSNKFTESKICYSQRVFIDLAQIFKLADRETTAVIWNHLLCISALVDPGGKAKTVLKENLESGKAGGNETEFLTNIIDKVEANVNPDANPMEAVSSILQSGIFTDLIGGMNNGLSSGELDIGKLMGAVQGMVGKLGDSSDDPSANNMINMMTSMMGNLTPPSQPPQKTTGEVTVEDCVTEKPDREEEHIAEETLVNETPEEETPDSPPPLENASD